MLSKLSKSPRLVIRLKPLLANRTPIINQAFYQPIRWSGHNAMNIRPSNFSYKYLKDSVHFWTLVTLVPIFVFTAIVSVRSNPELTEIPEDYEPRHWEYFKHPLTRFMAKHLFMPMETEFECKMAQREMESETDVMRRIEKAVDKTIRFYNDHRTRYFSPVFGEYFRRGRENIESGYPNMVAIGNQFIDRAHEPGFTPVPVEGFKPPE